VTVPQLILQAGEPEDLAGRGPWLAEDDRAHGLQKRVHVLQRPGACDVNEDEPAQVQDKPFGLRPCDFQQASIRPGAMVMSSSPVAVTVTITPSQLTSI
jgi:hypothetical protein